MFIFYCNHCNDLKVFSDSQGQYFCQNCNDKMISLGVPLETWNTLTNEEMLRLIDNANSKPVEIKKPVRPNVSQTDRNLSDFHSKETNEAFIDDYESAESKEYGINQQRTKRFQDASINSSDYSSGDIQSNIRNGNSQNSEHMKEFIDDYEDDDVEEDYFYGTSNRRASYESEMENTSIREANRIPSLLKFVIAGTVILVVFVVLLFATKKDNKRVENEQEQVQSENTKNVENDRGPEDLNVLAEGLEYTIGGISFTLPSNFKLIIENASESYYGYEINNEEGIYIGFTTQDNIFLNSNDFKENASTIDGIANEFIYEKFPPINQSTAQDTIVSGFETRSIKYDSTYNGFPTDIYMNIIHNTNDNSLIIVFFVISSKTPNSPYQDIINSAYYTGKDNTNKLMVSNASSSTETQQTNSSSTGVTPELKEFLDSYEAFMREYVDFMKKYSSNPANAISMLKDYTDILAKMEDFSKKADVYDQDEMSKEDLEYYLDAMSRIQKMYLEVL